MKWINNNWLFTLLALAIVVWGTVAEFTMVRINHITDQVIYDMLTAIGLLTVVIERSLEIIISVWRGKGRIDLDSNLRIAEYNLNEAKKGKKTPEEVESIQKKWKENEDKMETYRTETGWFSIRISFILGILISIAGFRILGTIYSFGDALISNQQALLFHSLDILITAGIIAGGSKGIHLLTATVGDFLETTRKKNKRDDN